MQYRRADLTSVITDTLYVWERLSPAEVFGTAREFDGDECCTVCAPISAGFWRGYSVCLVSQESSTVHGTKQVVLHSHKSVTLEFILSRQNLLLILIAEIFEDLHFYYSSTHMFHITLVF